MTYHLNIFDNVGLPRLDIPDAEISKLSKEQSAVFFSVIATFTETTEADAALITVEKAKRKAITDLKKAMEAHEHIEPKKTFFSEWKRTIAKIPEPAPDPEIAKRVKASIKGVEKLHATLEQLELDEQAAKQTRTAKRKAFASAIMAWSKIDGAPKSVGELVKARAATETAIKRENIAAGLPVDYAVERASTVGDSHLDRFKAGQGKGHSADRGYNSNRMRGAQLAPKVG